jgi:hypothetical protein
MHPGNLSLKPVNAKILGALAQRPAFVQLAEFASGEPALLFPHCLH